MSYRVVNVQGVYGDTMHEFLGRHAVGNSCVCLSVVGTGIVINIQEIYFKCTMKQIQVSGIKLNPTFQVYLYITNHQNSRHFSSNWYEARWDVYCSALGKYNIDKK